jgi:DNA-binding LacI/PurR family transcriptional regulator
MVAIRIKYMRITMKEIAKMAGVHRSTVDKVLHNREGVSDEVRLKIKKIIDKPVYSQHTWTGSAKKERDHRDCGYTHYIRRLGYDKRRHEPSLEDI